MHLFGVVLNVLDLSLQPRLFRLEPNAQRAGFCRALSCSDAAESVFIALFTAWLVSFNLSSFWLSVPLAIVILLLFYAALRRWTGSFLSII